MVSLAGQDPRCGTACERKRGWVHGITLPVEAGENKARLSPMVELAA